MNSKVSASAPRKDITWLHMLRTPTNVWLEVAKLQKADLQSAVVKEASYVEDELSRSNDAYKWQGLGSGSPQLLSSLQQEPLAASGAHI